VNPDTLLKHAREGMRRWSTAIDARARDNAVRDAFNAFESLDHWLSTAGRLPAAWQEARPAEGPDPDYLHDGVIACRRHGYAVTLKNMPCGTYATEVSARAALEREMAHRDYWPYAWLLESNLHAPVAIDLPPVSERRQYHWWVASKPSEDEFTYAAGEEVDPEQVPAMQAELNRRNAEERWLKYKLLRGDQVKP
jgi:hypothetical protein